MPGLPFNETTFGRPQAHFAAALAVWSWTRASTHARRASGRWTNTTAAGQVPRVAFNPRRRRRRPLLGSMPP